MTSQRCSAHNKRNGAPCKNWAILGGDVCRSHGGGAPQVKKKARERLALVHITPERTLLEIARIAYSDVASFFNDDGTLKKPQELDEDQRGFFAGFEAIVKNAHAGDGKMDRVVKVKLWDKPKALEILAKRFGLLTEKVEHAGDISFRWETVEDR
jgi:hypothetical protein